MDLDIEWIYLDFMVDIDIEGYGEFIWTLFWIKILKLYQIHLDYDYRSSVTAMLYQLSWRSLEQRRADAR